MAKNRTLPLDDDALEIRDPISLFETWLAEAMADYSYDADAASLATSSAEGQPSVRTVYFRGIKEGGFSFFTSYDSAKGRNIFENPKGAMLFYWPHLKRQVRVEGIIELLSAEASDEYFYQRPLESQISANVSKQSRSLKSPAYLQKEIEAFKKKWTANHIQRPTSWGGYKLVPARIEFWVSGEHRRHRRLLFTAETGSKNSSKNRENNKIDASKWSTQWLYP